MRGWRLVHARWSDTALSGEGASRYPGRWNLKGERVVYLASSLAPAMLETRVHVEVTVVEQPYVATQYDFPEVQLEQLAEPLPRDWQRYPEVTRAMGSKWLRRGASLSLAVPSVIAPVELN